MQILRNINFGMDIRKICIYNNSSVLVAILPCSEFAVLSCIRSSVDFRMFMLTRLLAHGTCLLLLLICVMIFCRCIGHRSSSVRHLRSCSVRHRSIVSAPVLSTGTRQQLSVISHHKLELLMMLTAVDILVFVAL